MTSFNNYGRITDVDEYAQTNFNLAKFIKLGRYVEQFSFELPTQDIFAKKKKL